MPPIDPAAHQPGAPVTERIIITQPPRRGFWSFIGRLFFFLFAVVIGVLGFGLCLGVIAAALGEAENNLSEQYHSLSKSAEKKIAIITVDGTILDAEGFVKKQIDHVRDDPHVRAVVLRVNSPGGTMTASDYLYHHLQKLLEERKLPMVVSFGGVAASGGYYIAMAVGPESNVIFAEPTTWSGSIGVIIPHYDITGLLKSWQIEDDSIKSGPLKQMGTPTRTMTAEERVIFEQLVDSAFKRFQEVVKGGRPSLAADPEALARVSTGRVFTTDEALTAGLVDKQGFIEDAIERAAEMAKLRRTDVRVVKYKKAGGLLSLPFSANARQTPDLAALLDLTSPRAYYLCTWLPSALAQP